MNQSANRLRFVLSCGARQSVSSFKAVWSLDSHFPVLTRSRSGNGHAPLAPFVGECMFDGRSDVAAQPNIPEILQLNCDSHPRAILSKTYGHTWCNA